MAITHDIYIIYNIKRWLKTLINILHLKLQTKLLEKKPNEMKWLSQKGGILEETIFDVNDGYDHMK